MQKPTSRITPSLAALDDAQTLRLREWIKGEHGVEMPWQYSSIKWAPNININLGWEI